MEVQVVPGGKDLVTRQSRLTSPNIILTVSLQPYGTLTAVASSTQFLLGSVTLEATPAGVSLPPAFCAPVQRVFPSNRSI